MRQHLKIPTGHALGESPGIGGYGAAISGLLQFLPKNGARALGSGSAISIPNRDRMASLRHKGQLRERGTHKELLTHRGLYWKLYQLQYKDREPGTAAAFQPLTAD